MSIKDFDWIKPETAAVPFLDIFYRKGVFPNSPNFCMFSDNKHQLAANLRSSFGFLTLHKSTLLAEKILREVE